MVSVGMFHATVEGALDVLRAVCPALPIIGREPRRGGVAGELMSRAQKYASVLFRLAILYADKRTCP